MIPIRKRLARILFLTVGSLAVLGALGVFLIMRLTVLSRFDETLTAKARALITASEIDDEEFEIDLTVQDFAGFGTGGDDYFEIFRLGGKPFLRSPSLESINRDLSEWRLEKPTLQESPKIENGTLEPGVPVRVYLQRFQPKDDELQEFGDLFMVVASPIRSLRLQFAILAIVLSGAVLAALVLMVPAIRIGLKKGLEPLENLSRELRAIRPGKLDHRLDSEALPDELRPVAENLNFWLGRLEESFDRERRFSSNAAHELRTPLAELKSISQMGATWEDAATPDRFREIGIVADEMTEILDKLALLSQADGGQVPVNREKVRLDEAVGIQLERLERRISEKSLTVGKSGDAGFVHTDPILWGAIARNLVTNAVEYAPDGTVITLEVHGDSLTISNDAPDLKEADLDRIFDRFWRRDDAHTGSGHSGLGLSIVRVCVDLLRGDCAVELTPEGCFVITISGLG